MPKKEPENEIQNIQKNAEEYIKAFEKASKDGTLRPNSTSVDPITGLVKFTPNPDDMNSQDSFGDINQSKRSFGALLSDIFTTSVDQHQWSRFSNVRGHLRTSVNGNVHFVSAHSRYTGDFWNWFAWTPLSWLAFPAIFIYMQRHSEATFGFIVLNLFVAWIGACLADAAIAISLVVGTVWLFLRIVS